MLDVCGLGMRCVWSGNEMCVVGNEIKVKVLMNIQEEGNYSLLLNNGLLFSLVAAVEVQCSTGAVRSLYPTCLNHLNDIPSPVCRFVLSVLWSPRTNPIRLMWEQGLQWNLLMRTPSGPK